MFGKRLLIGKIIFLAVMAMSAGFSSSAYADKHAKHIILIIGDGMQLEHEIATSRYLFGQDMVSVHPHYR